MDLKVKTFKEIVLGSNKSLTSFYEMYLRSAQIARQSPNQGDKS